jgi:hypothetical protein
VPGGGGGVRRGAGGGGVGAAMMADEAMSNSSPAPRAASELGGGAPLDSSSKNGSLSTSAAAAPGGGGGGDGLRARARGSMSARPSDFCGAASARGSRLSSLNRACTTPSRRTAVIPIVPSASIRVVHCDGFCPRSSTYRLPPADTSISKIASLFGALWSMGSNVPFTLRHGSRSLTTANSVTSVRASRRSISSIVFNQHRGYTRTARGILLRRNPERRSTYSARQGLTVCPPPISGRRESTLDAPFPPEIGGKGSGKGGQNTLREDAMNRQR